MKAPICRLCEHAHWNNESHVFASNAASNQGDSNGPSAASASNSSKASTHKKQIRGSAKEVEGVGQDGKDHLQRGVRNDGAQSGNVPASENGASGTGKVENDVLERGLDGGGRTEVKQRWARGAYNAYQRDLMRRRRAEAKNGQA